MQPACIYSSQKSLQTTICRLLNFVYKRAKTVAAKFRNFHTVLWQTQKFTLTLFWQKFCETNVFTKEITKVDLKKYFFGGGGRGGRVNLTTLCVEK